MLAHGYTCALDTTVPQRCMRPPGKKLQRCWARVNAIAGGCSEDRGVRPDGAESLLSSIARTSRRILLPKPDGPTSARPIGIGEALYRVAARALLVLTGAARIHQRCAAPRTVRRLLPKARSSRPSIRFHLQRYLAGRLNYVKVEYSWWTTRTRSTRWM